ncbi:MAG: MmcQ/YjbR family DNA-binding protein [Bacteroidetes bacterium]|nr:MmcQ/YjbR family DNA-binding protein [Bacteroidota bacterium]MCB0853455.1 MmcQ/YjbR family DNA-binding protein [Bacteroidota bacterium]
MNIELLREYCLSKKAATEGFPFDENTLVFKVMGKMFALTALEDPTFVNLKCDPEYAIELREEYPGIITPGFHMSKTHWNTVSIVDTLSDQQIRDLVDHSYDMVVAKLTKKMKAELEAMEE